MESTNEVIKALSLEFIKQNHPEEAGDFDRIWQLMPEDLSTRGVLVQREVETRFWDQLIHSPYVTDIVINIVAAILFELGLWSANKVICLIKERQRRARFEDLIDQLVDVGAELGRRDAHGALHRTYDKLATVRTIVKSRETDPRDICGHVS